MVIEQDVLSIWPANDAPSSECQSDGRWVVSNNADEKAFKEKGAMLLAAAPAGRSLVWPIFRLTVAVLWGLRESTTLTLRIELKA